MIIFAWVLLVVSALIYLWRMYTDIYLGGGVATESFIMGLFAIAVFIFMAFYLFQAHWASFLLHWMAI